MNRSDVFVVGRQPTVTYAARAVDAGDLGAQLRDYLDERGTVLVITGPSKSGKTVALRHELPPEDAIYVAGGRLTSIDALWNTVVARLGAITGSRSVETTTREANKSNALGAKLAPGGVGFTGDRTETERASEAASREFSASIATVDAAIDALKTADLPIVIDDFHYLSRELQREVVEALKDLVFDGVAVIFAAVPHRVADAVQAQPEMDYRVTSLKLGLWSQADLGRIATQGFGPDGLNVTCADSLAKTLAKYAWQSPHLMQRLCLQLCKANEVSDAADPSVVVKPPPSWEQFNRKIVESYPAERTVGVLAAGKPTKGTQRKQWKLASGGVADIYVLILRAIGRSGPKAELTLDELKGHVDDLLASGESAPKRGQLSGTLSRMADLAKGMAKDASGHPLDPAIEFDNTNENHPTIHILDPMLAFRLRWGPVVSGKEVEKLEANDLAEIEALTASMPDDETDDA